MKSLWKQNNKGMSLVEVIISVAIVSIILTVVFSFMVTGSRIFTSSTTEVQMQQDAQLVLNNIENRILDAQLGAYYEQDNATNPTFAKLTILNEGTREYIFWVGTENKIYYDSDTVNTADLDSIVAKNQTDLTGSGTKEMLAESVERFFVEFKETKVEETDVPKPKAYVALKMSEKDKNGTDRGIESTKTVSFRNNISTDVTSEKKLYTDARKELVSATSVAVTPNQYTMVVPSGDTPNTYKFNARVTGIGNPSQVVTWEVVGSPAGVTINEAGVVSVTKNATEESVTIVAKGIDNTEGTASIKLQKIGDVTVTVNTSDVYAGTFIKLNPGIDGTNIAEESKKFTYQVIEGNPTDIVVYSEDNGLIYLNPSSQGKSYKVRVISKYDTTKYTDVTIDVKDTSIVDSGSGTADAVRGASTEIVTSLTLVNLAENELNVAWKITDDDGLGGKVSINSKGEFTVAKDVNYEKSYDVEVMATVSAGRLQNSVTKLITVHIPKVSLSFTSEADGTIQKNSTETFGLQATGLVLAPEDVYVSTNPALSNCIVYPTKDGVQVSVGGGNKAAEFDLIATLKNTNTSTSKHIKIQQ